MPLKYAKISVALAMVLGLVVVLVLAFVLLHDSESRKAEKQQGGKAQHKQTKQLSNINNK